MFKAHCLGSFQTGRLDNPFLERSSWPITLGNLNLIQTYRLHSAKNTNQESLQLLLVPTIDRDLEMGRSRLGPKGSRLKAKESFILVTTGDNSPAVGEGSFCLNFINPYLLNGDSGGVQGAQPVELAQAFRDYLWGTGYTLPSSRSWTMLQHCTMN